MVNSADWSMQLIIEPDHKYIPTWGSVDSNLQPQGLLHPRQPGTAMLLPLGMSTRESLAGRLVALLCILISGALFMYYIK